MTKVVTHQLPRDRILLEYFYKGDEVEVDDEFIKNALLKQEETYENYVPKIFHENDMGWIRKINILPDYLTQKKLNQEDIDFFNNNHIKTMNWLLNHFFENMQNS